MGESDPDAPFTILSETRKKWTITIASLVTFVSPVSTNIYYPALNPLAHDLHVSPNKIILTITVFMIVQGIGPLMVAGLSDVYGRRPIVLLALLLYLGANIGLAQQTSYPILMALRCLQSFGSSTATVICSSVAADLVPRSERGRYMIYSSLGVTLGPAIGPILGGVLTQFLDWRSTFWFLAIWASIMIIILLIFVPETCRAVVGNGSIRPTRWNRSLVQFLHPEDHVSDSASKDPKEKRPARRKRSTPLDSLRVAAQKETGAIIIFTTVLFGGYFAVLSSLPSQLEHKYHFNALQVGLCYIPSGAGSLTSRWTVGKLIDWNFRRHAKEHGIEIVQNRQVKLIAMPVEKARLQVTLPAIYSASIVMIGYGWVMNYKVNLAGPLIMLFLISHFVAGATSTLITLIVDCHVNRPATATSANNLFRCCFGAGAVAAAGPLINSIGIGWTSTLIGVIWIAFSPVLWGIYFWGHDYRKAKKAC
ncbi:major facilitator superfamily domain-containing protein [Penicillium nucicola]|uniref:major facilitator superfamily domain-containing protein n=1 Tax=Penicillium nucicola TaxID=1850975 RepID=UPI0025451976|nr:major facilitator superfamily domain-containing protein [Penicillium nucicola]KAJ5766580.1 major facilitator superfamily domain-containing protein [Penicillium nucicola]